MSSRKNGQALVFIQKETDCEPQNGQVFMLLSGVKGKEEKKSIVKHWAVGIKLEDGTWITLEGLLEGDQLKSSYSRSSKTPSEKIMSFSGAAIMARSPDSVLPMQLFKCLSVEPIRKIRASPKQLQRIAKSIPTSVYTLSSNDCQTWVLEAMDKLQEYNLEHTSRKVVARFVSKTYSTFGNHLHEAERDWEENLGDYEDYSDEAQEVFARGEGVVLVGKLAWGGLKAVKNVFFK